MVELAELCAELVLRNREWFTRKSFNFPLIPSIVCVMSRLVCELPAGCDRVHALLCAVVDLLLRERMRDVLFIGRELVLLLLRVSKVQVFRPYWRLLLHNPRALLPAQLDSLQKLLAQRCNKSLVPSRIAFKLQFYIDHLLTYKPELVYQYYADFFVRDVSFEAGVSSF